MEEALIREARGASMRTASALVSALVVAVLGMNVLTGLILVPDAFDRAYPFAAFEMFGQYRGVGTIVHEEELLATFDDGTEAPLTVNDLHLDHITAYTDPEGPVAAVRNRDVARVAALFSTYAAPGGKRLSHLAVVDRPFVLEVDRPRFLPEQRGAPLAFPHALASRAKHVGAP
jgi:hypothetical protein